MRHGRARFAFSRVGSDAGEPKRETPTVGLEPKITN